MSERGDDLNETGKRANLIRITGKTAKAAEPKATDAAPPSGETPTTNDSGEHSV